MKCGFSETSFPHRRKRPPHPNPLRKTKRKAAGKTCGFFK
ncbi:hypothetical protein HMPREF9120_02044 [Neisseria sp. oral taxon 020 str. F0370]|nr:hypothetical protein HMPREF9120_02044 [Neisseria sp. oral taxon 020 str. F0370]